MTNPTAVEGKERLAPEALDETKKEEAEGGEEDPEEGMQMQPLLSKQEVVFLIKEEKEKEKEKAEKEAKGIPNGKLLPKDSFSFFVCGSQPAFLVATVAFLVQVFSLVVVTSDQFYSGSQTEENVMGIPAFITWPVRISQFLGLLIAVMLQMDVIWALNVFFRGFNEQAFRDVFAHIKEEQQHKHLKFWWYFSNCTRLFIGLYCLAVMFMLIMRSDTARVVLLSFNAVNFIGGVDKAVWALASWGYFGTSVQNTAKSIVIGDIDLSAVAKKFDMDLSQVPVPVPGIESVNLAQVPIIGSANQNPRSKIRCTNLKLWRTLTIVLIWLVLEVCWLVLTLKSINGDFLPTAIYVQFGDDEKPELGLQSGIYDCKVSLNDVRYVARPSVLLPHADVKEFRYCSSQKFWTLKAYGTEDAKDNQGGVCKGWVVKSSTTAGNPYNILGVADKKWSTKISSPGREGSVNLKSLIMKKRNKVDCSEGLFGPLCEFVERRACDQLSLAPLAFHLDYTWSVYGMELDETNRTLIPLYYKANLNREDTREYQYEILKSRGKLVLVHDRPVFHAYRQDIDQYEDDISNDFRTYVVIFCVGRRWARVVIGLKDPGNSPREKLARVIAQMDERFRQVGGVSTTYHYVSHLSSPFDMGTLDDTGSPIGLDWFQVSGTQVFVPQKTLRVGHTLQCQCPVCPDGITPSAAFNVTNSSAPFLVVNKASAFTGQNLTCEAVDQRAITTPRGSFRCNSLQMASIFDCGCSYVRPKAPRPCPLCANDAPVPNDMLDKVPFPDAGYWAGATCAEYSWYIDLRAVFQMKDNKDWCQAWQSTYGKACGCANAPAPPCDVQCPNEKDVFVDSRTVENVKLDPTYNGWLCAELRGALSVEKECTEESKNALAEACCVEQ